jgi:CheY-like chemotaxis protein
MDCRILIVDDIFVNRLLLKVIVKNFSQTYFEATNGREALEILAREELDVILMDIEMPVMNGLETTKYIREKLSSPKNHIPIIAITAYDPELFFNDFRDVGFNQLLTKPYTVDSLINCVKEVCKK